MEGDEKIRSALERNVKAVALRPAVGQGTAATKVKLLPGLACEASEGPWKLVVGMTDKYGGSNAGPNPGIYGRTALGSCLAIGYAMWAARLGVPIDALEIEVQADYDVRGELGVSDDVPPGYSAVRYIVRVESTAPEADVLRVLDTADRYSSYRDDFTRAVPVRREVRITAGAK
ncbi:MAG: OsmC family protein [Gemmatimonadetes bacterium]|nr:OsmC family protein [Gemmatimonadota bacterium]